MMTQDRSQDSPDAEAQLFEITINEDAGFVNGPPQVKYTGQPDLDLQFHYSFWSSNEYAFEVRKNGEPWISIGKEVRWFRHNRDILLEGKHVGQWRRRHWWSQSRFEFLIDGHVYTSREVRSKPDWTDWTGPTVEDHEIQDEAGLILARVRLMIEIDELKLTLSFEDAERLWLCVFFAGFFWVHGLSCRNAQ